MESDWNDQDILIELQSPSGPEANRSAWTSLVSKYDVPLKRRAAWEIQKHRLYVALDLSDEDAVQTVWTKGFERITQCQGNIRGWLYTILINHVRDAARKKRLENNPANWSLDEELNEDGFTGLDNAEAQAVENDTFIPDYPNLGVIQPNLEQAYLDESMTTQIHVLLKRFLTRSESEFLMAYREDNRPKTARDKTRFHRLKLKLGEKMISSWVVAGKSLNDIMPPIQSNVLRAKYSLKQRDAEIFHNFNISNKTDLDHLLTDGFERLFNAFLESESPT